MHRGPRHKFRFRRSEVSRRRSSLHNYALHATWRARAPKQQLQRAGQRMLAIVMPTAGERRDGFFFPVRRLLRLSPPVTPARQGDLQLFLRHRLDEAAHRVRTPSSIGSNQLSKTIMSAATAAAFVLSFVTARSLSSAPNLESFGLGNPETMPTKFQPLPRRCHACTA